MATRIEIPETFALVLVKHAFVCHCYVGEEKRSRYLSIVSYNYRLLLKNDIYRYLIVGNYVTKMTLK